MSCDLALYLNIHDMGNRLMGQAAWYFQGASLTSDPLPFLVAANYLKGLPTVVTWPSFSGKYKRETNLPIFYLIIYWANSL